MALSYDGIKHNVWVQKWKIYALNPGEVTDHQIVLSALFSSNDNLPVAELDVKTMVKPSNERDLLYRKRYEEG